MQSIQIAASEIWVTLIILVIMYLFKGELTNKKATKTLMIVCVIRLLSDAISWAFDGLPGVFFGLLTRCSNYVTFLTNGLVSLVFSIFLWELLKKDNEQPSIILKAYWLIEIIAMFMLTLNLYFGWFYYFDSNNLYHRGTYYHLTHIAPFIALFMVLWLLLRYRQRFNKKLLFLAWSYFILMMLATVYELMNFGLSLQTYAQTFSAIVAFFVGEIELRENLIKAHASLEKTNKELKEEEKKAKESLTAELEMEDKLRKQQAQLSKALLDAKKANKAKSDFLNNMSHDIRTPMNAIIGFTSLACSSLDNPAKVKEYLDKINVSSEHLLALINDVLDMSRIDSGKVKLDEKPLHLPSLIHDLRTIIEPSATSKQIEFTIDVIDVVDEDIIADKLRLTQVLLNILSNGVKYNKAGGILSLSIIQEKNAPLGFATYHFVIKDTGIGMSEEFQEHIFENFSREETSTVSGIQGTGLGMAITKKSVEMMKGTIELTSKINVGTSFDVCLTFKIDNSKADDELSDVLNGQSVLVVDDDKNACLNIANSLTKLGMCPKWVTTSKEAIEETKKANDGYYAYIVDWLMLDRNGIETIYDIKKIIGDSKAIIILMANDYSAIEKKAKEAGVNVFCEKPLFISDLKRVLLNPNMIDKTSVNIADYKGKRIFLVEDNALNQEIALTVLQDAGFIVDTAHDGNTAVEKMKLANTKYDLILMDIQMPFMNGYEATRKIRALDSSYCKKIPIIAMTANAFEEDKALALQAGMNDYLAKPIQIDKMLNVISKYLDV